MTREVIIGVYNDYDPINSMRKERLDALLKESREQNVRLVFFENEDIDFAQKIVNGKYHAQNGWQNIKTRIPEVTINLFPTVEKDKTIVDLKLSNETIYTTHLISGKLGVYERILNSGKLTEHVIPSERIHTVEEIMDYMEKEKEAVLKPTGGRQGQNIYFLYNEKGKIYLKDHLEKVEVDLRGLKRIIGDKIDQNEYIIQPYINARTKKDEPYDFRMHAHRDKNGEWKLIYKYCRIGKDKSILSNLAQGGSSNNVEEVLKRERPENWKEINEKLDSLTLDLAEHINSFYNFKIDELGIDLSLDDKDNIWMYEANTGPETDYYEEERAVYAISYAKFLMSEKIEKDFENQLESLSLAILEMEKNFLFNSKNNKVIGILGDTLNYNNLNMACSFLAENQNFNLYYFTKDTIDMEKNLVLGHKYEGNKVKEGFAPYPDLIINLSSLKEEDEKLKELVEIPKTRDIELGVKSKFEIQRSLLENEKLADYILEHLRTDNIEKIKEFILGEEYLVLKDENQVRDIVHIDENLNLEELVTEEVVVQKFKSSKTKDGRPFSIKFRMLKDGKGEWKSVKPYVQVNNNDNEISSLKKGGFILPLDSWDFIQEETRESLFEISKEIARQVDFNLEGKISILEMTFGIDDDENIFVYDVDLDNIETRFAEMEMAEIIFSHGLGLI